MEISNKGERKMRLIKNSFYLILSLVLLSSTISTYAKGEEGKKGKVLYKTTGTPGITKFNISNVSTFIGNDGYTDNNITGDSGFQFPIGSGKTVFYESGFIYGGYVNREWRVGGSTYTRGQLAGRILGTGATATRESADLPHVRIYRVRRDYKDPNADYSKEISDEGSTKDAIFKQYDTDWKEWRWQDGAPYDDVNKDGKYDPNVDIPGIPGADQTIWFVANDMDATQAQKLYGSVGLGIEMQATAWGYNQQNALGDGLFRKFVMINKGATAVDSCYVAMWSDPDLGGDAADDLAGCDTTLSLGFVYNGDDGDPSYGTYIPASGFDFLQGPIVKGLASDVAIFKNKTKPGYKNLPMSAFFLFTQGNANYGDPTLGNYTNGALRVRNLFQGKVGTLGTPFRDPLTGKTSKYFAPGDPVTGQGWVDGILFPKNDRRIGTVAGPFVLAAGDTQEVVVGQLAAGGIAPIDRLGAVALLKYQDLQVQQAYNNFFKVPTPPKAPIVQLDPITKLGKATEMDQELVINWGEDQATVAAIEAHNELGYKFQGYCVYQLPRITSQLNEGKLVATFDLNDLVGNIESTVFDTQSKTITKKFTKFGQNTGIQRYIRLNKDYIRSGQPPLANGTEYYYVVSAYSYNPDPSAVPNVLETLSSRIKAVPHQANPGVRYGSSINSVVPVTHTKGGSDGNASVKVIDPTKTNGNTYEVSFTGTSGNTKWDLTNKTTGVKVLTGVSEFLGTRAPIVDGLQIDVTGAANDVKYILVTENANGKLATPAMGCFAFNSSGFPLSPSGEDRPGSTQQKNGNNVWGIHTAEVGDGTNATFTFFKTRTTQSNARWPLLIPNDFEIRFKAGAKGWIFPGSTYGSGGKMADIPFELWNVGMKADASDDVRYFPYVLDESNANAGNGKFDLSGVDHTISGGTNDPQTDWFYWAIPKDQTPGQAGYNAIVAQGAAHAYLDPTTTAGTDAWRRMVLVGWNLADVSALGSLAAGKEMPEVGTVFKLITTKPNQPGTTGDFFTFTAPSVTIDAAIAKDDVENINVFPNPYYGVNPREINKYQRYVTFSHLPQVATFRIFNLAGQLVRILQKDSPSQFFTWDLVNGDSFPVASGLYIVHIDMPDLGKTKILKLAVIQEQQILDHF